MRRICIKHPRCFQFEKERLLLFDSILMRNAGRVLFFLFFFFEKARAALFRTKLKCFSREIFKFPSTEGAIFPVHFHYIRCAICSAAKYSSGERFALRGFQIRQLPDAPTVFTRISTANCSFSVYGTLKSFWRLCRMKNQLTRRNSLLTRIKPLMMYFLEMSGKLILLLVIL